MIVKKDIDNVTTIIEKAKKLAQTENERQKFEKLSRDFAIIGNRYLNEVTNNDRLQRYN